MISDFINNLSRLSNSIFHLMESTASNADFNVDSQDARLVALSGMQEAVLSCGLWLKTYHSIGEGHQNESMILNYSGSNLSLEKTSKIMLNQIRLGLVIMFHFKLENLLGCLLKKISNKNNIRGLGQMFKVLAEDVNLDDTEKKSNILKAFSSIRNSLHNNGIHTHPDFETKIGEYNYKFNQDEVTTSASLSHSIHLIGEIIVIAEEILNSEKVKDIKDMIPEKYSEWLDEQ